MSKSAFTILEWCKDNSISKSMYYKLQAAGRAPISMKVGKRRLISAQAAEAWRNQMEQDTSAKEAK